MSLEIKSAIMLFGITVQATENQIASALNPSQAHLLVAHIAPKGFDNPPHGREKMRLGILFKKSITQGGLRKGTHDVKTYDTNAPTSTK